MTAEIIQGPHRDPEQSKSDGGSESNNDSSPTPSLEDEDDRMISSNEAAGITCSDDDQRNVIPVQVRPNTNITHNNMPMPVVVQQGHHSSSNANAMHTHYSAAWDVPPLVASPYTHSTTDTGTGTGTGTTGITGITGTAPSDGRPFWKTRKCRPVTPQHMASILLLSDIPYPEDDRNNNNNNATNGSTGGVAEGDLEGPSSSSISITILNEEDEEDEDGVVGTTGNTTTNAMDARDGATNKIHNPPLPVPTSTTKVASSTTCSCPPLLWNQEFLMVALVTGEIRVYGNLLGTVLLRGDDPSKEIHNKMRRSMADDDEDDSSSQQPTPSAPFPNNNNNNNNSSPTGLLANVAPLAATPPTILAPLATLILPSDSFIVQIIPGLPQKVDKTHAKREEEEQEQEVSSFIALSVEGHVYQFRFLVEKTSQDSSSYSYEYEYTLELEHSWKTGSLGATCMTVAAATPPINPPTNIVGTSTKQGEISSSTPSSSKTQQSQHPETLLLIGYTSGSIECWKLLVSPTSTNTASTSSSSSSRTTARMAPPRTRRRPHCLWKGLVEEPYSVMSLQVLLPPPPPPPPPPSANAKDHLQETTETTTFTTENQQDDPLVLISTLQTPVGEEPPILQAFDLGAICSRATNGATVRQTRDDAPNNNNTASSDNLPLVSFRILPDPAMGLIEPTNTTSSNKNMIPLLPPDNDDDDHEDSRSSGSKTPRLPYPASTTPNKLNSIFVPSQGANRAIPLHQGRACGICLANGTVGIVSPGWGISCDAHQLLLSYPAIGMGQIVLWNNNEKDEEEERKNQEYLVCCLRAGTCYLIPIGDDNEEDDERPPATITTIGYPHDVDADTTSVYVQEFTAGSLKTTASGSRSSSSSTDDSNPTTVPVLIYVLPGGVIEIYSCQLLPPSINEPAPPSIEDQVLQEMIQQGCFQMTLQVLKQKQEPQSEETGLEIDESNAGQKELWDRAKKEVDSCSTSAESSLLTMSSPLESLKKMPAFRSLLLDLASTA